MALFDRFKGGGAGAESGIPAFVAPAAVVALVRNLKQGRVAIPEKSIRSRIEKILREVEGLELKACFLLDEGCRLELAVTRSGARFEFPLNARVHSICLDAKVQLVEIDFSSEKPEGKNLLGRFVALVPGRLVSQIIYRNIADNPLAAWAEMGEEGVRVGFDLSALEELRPLKKNIPLLGRPLLEFLQIHGAEHVSGGLILKGGLGAALQGRPGF